MPQVKCKICPNKFYVKPSHQKLGYGKFCSRDCQYKAQLKGKFVKCAICDKKFWRAPRMLKRSKSGKFFCSKSCHMIWKNKIMQVGERHPNWINGESAGRGILGRSKRIKKCAKCKINDIRVLAVHHIDKNRKNNKLSNLMWLCHNCHHLVHRYKMSI